MRSLWASALDLHVRECNDALAIGRGFDSVRKLFQETDMDSFFGRFSAYQPQFLGILRIMAALLFLAHGTQKLLGFPAREGGGPDLLSLSGIAGMLELVGGALLVIGLFTRPVAFVLSGLMAFAYFIAHAPRDFYPVNNGGDAAILFCFVFLYFVASGPGAWSVDAARGPVVRDRRW